MSWTAIATLVLLAFAVGMIYGYMTGREQGEQLGRDKQWMDDFFARIEKEKQRRDSHGRFKTKSR
jgi:hypothetical protein